MKRRIVGVTRFRMAYQGDLHVVYNDRAVLLLPGLLKVRYQLAISRAADGPLCNKAPKASTISIRLCPPPRAQSLPNRFR